MSELVGWFPSIGSFRDVVSWERDNAKFHERDVMHSWFTGTVKIHGTNAGVRIGDQCEFLSKRQVLSADKDNVGFHKFASGKEEFFREIAKELGLEQCTIFGEFCGKGINKGTGVQKLDRHFVIFGAWNPIDNSFVEIPDGISKNKWRDQGIHFVNEVDSYGIYINFNKPQEALPKLEELTLQVEERCPWVHYMSGDTTVGEGIVWKCDLDPHNHRLWFKTKGLKHKANKSKKPKIPIEPEKLSELKELAELITPEWRLEQGIEFLRENGYPIERTSTTHFLMWVKEDVIKEESDRIAANNYFHNKEIFNEVYHIARNWFMEAVDKEVFGA